MGLPSNSRTAPSRTDYLTHISCRMASDLRLERNGVGSENN